MRRDVARALDVAVHERRARAQSDLVRGGHDLDPALGHELARREDLADLVVEDLRRRAGDRAESLVAQHHEVVAQAHAVGLLLAEVDLLGRERVDVQVGQLVLQRAHDLAVPEAVLVGVDAALDADLGGAARDRFVRAPDDVLERAVVGVFLVLVAREAAEAAADVADVREVDVAADDVGDLVADVVEARAVGHRAQHLQVATARTEQDLGVGARELAPLERTLEHGADGCARATQNRVGEASSGGGHLDSSASPARRSTRAGGAASRARRTRACSAMYSG